MSSPRPDPGASGQPTHPVRVLDSSEGSLRVSAKTSRRGPQIPAALRRWLRAVHRDAGYLAVGLTLIYAASGLAVNHISDWDPNFTQIRQTSTLSAATAEELRALPLVEKKDAAAALTLGTLGRKDAIEDAYAPDDTHLDITLEKSTIYVDLEQGTVVEEGQKSRFLLRVANWLHLNRGKRAWTYIADAYAAGLLLLATSGLFMIPGRKGLAGRGAILVGLGVAVPVVYVVLSGGP